MERSEPGYIKYQHQAEPAPPEGSGDNKIQ